MSCTGHSCPLCGSVPTKYSESQPVNQVEKIRQLFNKAQRLDSAMKTLAEVRISTLQQINAIRSPPNSLPNELLAYIFNLACPHIDFSKRAFCESDDDDDFFDGLSDNTSDTYPKPRNKHDLSHRYMPVTLSAVCGRWREVALSSPELWSTFAIEVIGWKLKTQVPLLRSYLTNTGPLPFSLDLDIRLQQCVYIEKHDDHAPVYEWGELEPLADLIFQEFPQKIRALRVAGAPPGWMCFLSRQRFPNLQDLTFAWGEDMGEPTTVTIKDDAFSILPGDPLHLSVATSTLRPTPGLPSLTTLHLRNVYIDICVKILLSCPYLIEYHCYTPPNPPSTPVVSSRRPVCIKEPFTLSNLKRFGWISPEGDEWNIALLENIRTPNLEELQWCGFPEESMAPDDADVVSRFFSNLPKTLRSLVYYDYNFGFFENTEEYLTNCRLLSHFPHVQSLAFHKCSGSFIKPVFNLLSNRTPETDSTFLLPRLERIAVRNYEDDGEDIGIALVEMLEMRRLLLRISRFTFEAIDCEVVWSHDAQDGLRELAYEFSLTVLEKSQERVYAYFTERELALFS